MMISVSDNIKELSKALSDIQRNQLPYATALALNDVATDVADELTRQMPNVLDRPTPFTLKAFQPKSGKFYGMRATKQTLVAVIDPSITAAGKARMSYLMYQIQGGVRHPQQKAILVPTRFAPKNKYGNVSKANREKMLTTGGKFFSAGQRESRTPGIYKKIDKKTIQPFAFYVQSAQYKPRFPVQDIASGVVKSKFNYRFTKALEKALATAK